MKSIIKFFLSIGMLWKLQAGFFGVALASVIIVRVLSYLEFQEWLTTIEKSGIDQETLNNLNLRLASYIDDSIWQSGLEFLLLFIIVAVAGQMLVNPIRSLCRALKMINSGDLTVKVKQSSYDEIGDLEENFNKMQGSLCSIMCDIEETSRHMTHSAFQIKTISSEISKNSQSEQEHSQEVAEATSLLKDTSASVSSLTQEVAVLSSETEAHVVASKKRVSDNLQEMEATANEISRAAEEMLKLNQTAGKVHEIIDNITNIADQTNLLALNAAIEAARAGDAGRGFAIVADEVRKLASSTAKSADEITKIIGTLSSVISDNTNLMKNVVESVQSSQEKSKTTGEEINVISKDVSETASKNRKISELTLEQMEHLKLLEDRINGLFLTINENSRKATATTAIGDDLYEESERLKKTMSEFRFDHATKTETFEDERRLHRRFPNHLRIHIDDGKMTAESICKDISLGGMQIRTKEFFDESGEIAIKIFLPYDDIEKYENQVPLSVRAKICWRREIKEDKHYGVEFFNLKDNELDNIKKCIDYFNNFEPN